MNATTNAVRQDKIDRKANAEAMLRKFCPKGTTVYGIVRSVYRSGMSRRIDFYAIDKADAQPVFLTGYIATLLGMRWPNDVSRGGLVVGGCGMDMIFHVVQNLSMALYCPDKYDHDAAYALRSEQL